MSVATKASESESESDSDSDSDSMIVMVSDSCGRAPKTPWRARSRPSKQQAPSARIHKRGTTALSDGSRVIVIVIVRV